MSKVRIAHISDTHGWAFDNTSCPDDVEIVVHSGDLLPNRTFGIREIEVPFQTHWIEENAPRILDWLGGRPLVMVMGNHDFVRFDVVVRCAGHAASIIMLDSETERVRGVRFAGFPYVPFFNGDWNLELGEIELGLRFRPIEDAIDNGDIDVLVAHSPMYGVLDRNGAGTRCGSKRIRNAMSRRQQLPKAYLHGHIHERGSQLHDWRGMLVSNAACAMNVFTVEVP